MNQPLLLSSTRFARSSYRPGVRAWFLRSALAFSVVALVSGCSDSTRPGGDGGADAAGSLACTSSLPTPACCNAEAQRVTGASCSGGTWSCTEGALCECNGEPQTFACTDACGSDSWVDPTCSGGTWQCAAGRVRTDSCPGGTCWGSPGDLCINPSCVDGSWQCESIADGG